MTREVYLFNSVTADEVGEYTADILVYLQDYPSVTTQFQLLFNIELEPSPEEESVDETEQIDPGLEDATSQETYVDPNCEIKTLISFKKEPFHLPSELDLKDDLFNDGDLI